MSKPIAIAKGIAFASPDVCRTPAPPGSPVPIPYPNIAQLADASPKSDEGGKELLIGPAGDHALLQGSVIKASTGNEAGSAGGVRSNVNKKECELVQGSATVLYGPGKIGLVRFLDRTKQNAGNAQGFVLSSFPSVLVGD